MLRELHNQWDIENLPLWQRPIAYGTTSQPLVAAVFGMLLLVIVHAVRQDDHMTPFAASLVLLGAALQAVMGLGFWFLAATLDDRVFATFGSRERFSARDVAVRAPNVALALATVAAAGYLVGARRARSDS
jgi:ABC-type Fe3+-siderophore transport system permease subunit